MIFVKKDNKLIEFSEIYFGKKPLVYIYYGSKLVWQKIKELFSCFSNGYWIDQYPWRDNNVWKD